MDNAYVAMIDAGFFAAMLRIATPHVPLPPVTIPAGASSTTVDVVVRGDVQVETDETFLLFVSNVRGALVADNVGVGTIVDDDVSLSIADVSVAEGNSGTRQASFTVQLSKAASAPVGTGSCTPE